MNKNELRKKNIPSINQMLIALYKKRLVLNFKKKNNEDVLKYHLFKIYQKDIAQLLTVKNEIKNKKNVK